MSVTLDYLMHSVWDEYLKRDITEIAVNRPREVYLEEKGTWACYEDKRITMEWLHQFAQVVATNQKQEVSEKKPLLSTTLSSGLRIQIVLPPAVAQGTFAMAIRKPGSRQISWEDYREKGFFSRIRSVDSELSKADQQLLSLLNDNKYEQFLKYAVASKKNIVVSGVTSSGKTTFTNLLLSTVPLHERLIIIEDSQEINIPHQNIVRLIYSKGGQGVAQVTPEDDLEVCLRLTPDRIIMGEVRGPETFAFMDTIFSGHDGCITSMHASTPSRAFQRLRIMFKKSEIGRSFETNDIDVMLRAQIDIIVQIQKESDYRYISEIYFDPVLQQKCAALVPALRAE
jgi:type IV secretion system protein VirB11